MRIDRFWVVVKPRPLCGLEDICFESNAKDLAAQFLGGLNPGEVHAIFVGQGEAEKEAKRILAAFNAYERALERRDTAI